MVDVGLSAVHRKLLDYGIDESVAAELDHIHQSGTVTAQCFACALLLQAASRAAHSAVFRLLGGLF